MTIKPSQGENAGPAMSRRAVLGMLCLLPFARPAFADEKPDFRQWGQEALARIQKEYGTQVATLSGSPFVRL